MQAYRVGRQMRVDAGELEDYKVRSKETPQEIKTADGGQEDKNNTSQIVISGQDGSLDILARHLEKDTVYRPLRSYTGSLDSLIAMYKGETHIVSTHLFDGETLQYNIPYVRKLLVSKPFIVVRFLQREIGFYTAIGNPKNIQDWADLARKDVMLVNREPGAGARVLLDEKLRLAGINRRQVHGYDNEQMSHQDVAAAVAAGKSDVGIGIKQVATSANIQFVPLLTENYDLVMLADKFHLPLADKVLELLQQADFRERLASLGYQIKDIGKIIWQQ
ncbi:substrate-binding domain-containing protein [Virgibacillus halophilus]|uniref:Substrate-binding domain-containing protein n=1 Tax=Tigheibacillus halophilus TaxID=361280 RepID=A0ABU5C762_9BACI|nr:substrate-binding domain-containing protein [Virgibacillus halophilus]